MTTVPQLAHTLQTLFTTTAEQLARQTGFVRRTSKLILDAYESGIFANRGRGA